MSNPTIVNSAQRGNPSSDAAKSVRDDDFMPMSGSERMLEVPPIEGYVLYWFADRPGRIGRKLAEGWEFVSPDEVRVPNFKTISGTVAESGSTDLGTRISVHGYEGDNGQSVRLYLLKIKRELWARRVDEPREMRSEQIAAAMKGRRIGLEHEAAGDAARRYAPQVSGRTTLFDKKRK